MLPAIAALGAIASIATINWMAQERTPDRARAKRKAEHGAARSREPAASACTEIFRRFQRNPGCSPAKARVRLAAEVRRARPARRADAARLYQQLVNDVASMLVLASQNAFDVMCAVEDGEINAPEQLFFGFGEQQERLNKLIQDRATLKATVDTGVEVAERLTELVRELKKHRAE